MNGRSFRSLFMIAGCAIAALSCYLVSLRVASERAALESVETEIVLAQRDLRVLQTEIGTRGRLAQLERWNVKVLALSAPSADQFLQGGFELARLAQPQRKVGFEAPVVLASAPAPQGGAVVTDDSASAPATTVQGADRLLHEASLKPETREVPATPAIRPQAGGKSKGPPATAAKPDEKMKGPADRPGLAAAKPATTPMAKKSVDKAKLEPAKAMTKPTRVAKADPLAPLGDKRAGSNRPSSNHRDSAPKQ